jgi:hypothetical protein
VRRRFVVHSGKQECAVKEVANIHLVLLPNGEPGVRFQGAPGFEEVPVMMRVALLIASIQLCGAAINAICEDNPDDVIDVEAMMNAISITPSPLSVN